MLDELNGAFALGGALKFEAGQNGWPKACMRAADGHGLEVYLYGATVSSWTTPGGQDLLFMSSRASFSEGKAIRGGIPIVFPQFAGGKLPSHGFARTNLWQVRASAQSSSAVRLTLGLAASEQSLSIWPYRFELEYRIELSSSLTTSLVVRNRDEKAMEFQNALHTYFQLRDVSRCEVRGLAGLGYLDNLRKREQGREDREVVTIAGEVDRIYVSAPNTLTIRDLATPRSFSILKHAMCDAVLWNPWINKSRELPDMGDDDYVGMLCLEAGNISAPIALAPGAVFECSQVISYS